MRGDRNRTPKWKTHLHLQRLYKQHIVHTVFIYFKLFRVTISFFITNISTYSFIDSHKQPSWSIWKKIFQSTFSSISMPHLFIPKWLFIGKCLELVSSAVVTNKILGTFSGVWKSHMTDYRVILSRLCKHVIDSTLLCKS